MDELYWQSLLYDIYADLLTDRQKEILRLHLQEDYSLAEIAQVLGISRQGASETIHRAMKQLSDLESKLHMATRFAALSRIADDLCAQIQEGADRETLLHTAQLLQSRISLPGAQENHEEQDQN